MIFSISKRGRFPLVWTLAQHSRRQCEPVHVFQSRMIEHAKGKGPSGEIRHFVMAITAAQPQAHGCFTTGHVSRALEAIRLA
jgi:hypothetical protein